MNYKEKLEPYIEKKWLEKIAPFLELDEGQKILSYLTKRKAEKRILPNQVDMFNAFKYTPWDDVRVVILGQSPYYHIVNGKPEGHGLAFSYQKGENDLHVPESLKVIRNELENDVFNGELINMDTDLTRWAKQGVLLLNSALTTEEWNADAHLDLWRPFTSFIIRELSLYHTGIIYCLWGKHAKSYKHLINSHTNFILEAGHPATELYNARGSYYGCKHFSKVNEILLANNNYTIAW